jgi:hypothetical protein
VREIRTLRAMWRALETGSSLKIYAPALDPTGKLDVREQPFNLEYLGRFSRATSCSDSQEK